MMCSGTAGQSIHQSQESLSEYREINYRGEDINTLQQAVAVGVITQFLKMKMKQDKLNE